MKSKSCESCHKADYMRECFGSEDRYIKFIEGTRNLFLCFHNTCVNKEHNNYTTKT